MGEGHPDTGYDLLLLYHYLFGSDGADDDCEYLLYTKGHGHLKKKQAAQMSYFLEKNR